MAYIKNWNPPQLETLITRWDYPVSYALTVWTGFQRSDGTRAPGRPWTDAAISEMDFTASFKKHYEAKKNMRAAFIAMCEEFDITLQDVIRSPIWRWDRVTIRKHRPQAGLQRDIVDSAELLNSQRMTLPH